MPFFNTEMFAQLFKVADQMCRSIVIQAALALALIESHYFRNNVIPDENSILSRIDTLRNIPTTIIHGRYDIITPIVTAQRLHDLWPEADYIVVPDGGHSALDPSVRSRLIEATENAKHIR